MPYVRYSYGEKYINEKLLVAVFTVVTEALPHVSRKSFYPVTERNQEKERKT